MAETKKTVTAEEAKKPAEPERVILRLPLDPDPKAPREEFFSVNGKNYVIQKGRDVLVPPEIKEVWENGEEQRRKALAYTDEKMLREPQ